MKKFKIGIIGLGYVGLPLATAFSQKFKTIGYDINEKRISDLKKGIDTTLEIKPDHLKKVLINNPNEHRTHQGFFPTNKITDLSDCNIYIITVPTPIDKTNRPDLTPIVNASEKIGRILSEGDIVIYESTVYPGVTEDICVPILEKTSKLTFNKNFYVGYSPERINPGDKEHTVQKIRKVTSGSTPKIARVIDELYKDIIEAGTYLASSIKVAEAAKVIENAQRDINIAFVNELSKIFRLMHIDTGEVLAAAATKWNFLKFSPGLVGGHCIGVDPYYLAQKAQEMGYHPEIILAGRRLNDSMGKYVAAETIKLLIKNDHKINEAKILILGFTFKENCPDYRNTKVIDIYQELLSFNAEVKIYDPWINEKEVKRHYNANFLQSISNEKFHGIILAVPHDDFKDRTWKKSLRENGVIFDVKGQIEKNESHGRL